MNKSSIILAIIASAFYYFQFGNLQTMTAQGNVVTETITMSDISSVGLGISATVYLTPGSKQKIEIKGQKDIIDNIEKEAKNGSWNIKFKDGHKYQNYESVDIFITITKLDALSLGGSGAILGKEKFSDLQDLKLSIGGSGNIELDVEANEISSSIGGSGNITLKGEAENIKISIGGSGNVNAENLKTVDCKVSTAGSGDVSIDVSGDLKVSIAGSGNVRYKGNPNVNSSSVGSGKVKSL